MHRPQGIEIIDIRRILEYATQYITSRLLIPRTVGNALSDISALPCKLFDRQYPHYKLLPCLFSICPIIPHSRKSRQHTTFKSIFAKHITPILNSQLCVIPSLKLWVSIRLPLPSPQPLVYPLFPLVSPLPAPLLPIYMPLEALFHCSKTPLLFPLRLA
jgi:hypothetical protein